MVSQVFTFLTIGLQLARVMDAAADQIRESTPEERAEIAHHVAAIYRILRDAAEQRGDAENFPMLMLGPATHGDSPDQRMERLQSGMRGFRRTFQRYRRNLDRERRGQVLYHVRELGRIGSAIGRRTRARH